MSFLKRLGYYLGGFSAGLIFLAFFLTVKKPNVITVLKLECSTIFPKKNGDLQKEYTPSFGWTRYPSIPLSNMQM